MQDDELSLMPESRETDLTLENPAGSTITSDMVNTWIEVDAKALAYNLKQVRGLLRPGTRIAAVTKASAYGHGPRAAAVFAEAVADMLAVTHLSEALDIRRIGVKAPILLFSPQNAAQLPVAVANALTVTIGSADDARLASAAAIAVGHPLFTHVKVDTGMGRIGVLPEDAPALLRLVRSLPGLQAQGIYMHFGTAMSRDLARSREQWRLFQGIVSAVRSEGGMPLLAHCANSAALLQMPETHMDMVRVGTLLYGQYPASFLSGRLALRSTWRMFTRVLSLKDVPAGWAVGYGAERTTTRPSRLATIPVGYADGLAVQVSARSVLSFTDRLRAVLAAMRGPSHLYLLSEGRRVPVIGRVGMQISAIDVTDFPDIQVGSALEVPCRRVTSNPLIARIFCVDGTGSE